MPKGVPLWSNVYNGPADGHDQPQASSSLAIGPDGAVYVTGASDGNYTTQGNMELRTKHVSQPD